MPRLNSGRTGFAAAVERIVTIWALLGGLSLILMVLVNLAEVVSGVTEPWTGRFAGSVELTSLFAAMAAFCFLPYCQLTDANVTADIFTANASPRWVAIFKFVATIVAVCVAFLILVQMYEGMLDQRRFGLATAILNVPVWPVYAFGLVSLALLILAAFVNLLENLGGIMRGTEE